jgi:hypothetical protein
MNGLRLSDIYKFAERPVESGWLRPAMTGIHFADGWAEATDAHILIREKYGYNPELEGKIIGRYGEEIDAVFPDISKVIPSFMSDSYHSIYIDQNMLYDICRVLDVLVKCYGEQKYIKVGISYFTPQMLKTIAATMVRFGCCCMYQHRDDYLRPSVVPLGYGVMMIMPCGFGQDYDYFDFSKKFLGIKELCLKLKDNVDMLQEQLNDFKIVRNYSQFKGHRVLAVRMGKLQKCMKILLKYN